MAKKILMGNRHIGFYDLDVQATIASSDWSLIGGDLNARKLGLIKELDYLGPSLAAGIKQEKALGTFELNACWVLDIEFKESVPCREFHWSTFGDETTTYFCVDGRLTAETTQGALEPINFRADYNETGEMVLVSFRKVFADETWSLVHGDANEWVYGKVVRYYKKVPKKYRNKKFRNLENYKYLRS